MRNLNYIYNGKRYVFSGTQYENPDKGTMRMQYTTQRTFTTTENATTTIQTATGTVTYPDTAITRYVYSTSSLMTTQKVTNMSSGTVRYGLTTDPEAAKYSPMPFVKENKTLYLGRSWTTYERATDPKEVDKIKTMVTTTYTTSKDFKHTSSSEYETDGKETIPYDATVGSYYSQMQYITDYQTYDGFTTGGLFSTRNLTYTANNAYVTFNQTSSVKSIKKYMSITGFFTYQFGAKEEYVTTGGFNVFPGYYFATSESALNTVTLHFIAQTSISYITNKGEWYIQNATQSQSTTMTIDYGYAPPLIVYGLRSLISQYGTVTKGTFYATATAKSSTSSKNTRRISYDANINGIPKVIKTRYDANEIYWILKYATMHDWYSTTCKRTYFTKNVDEETFYRSYYSATSSSYYATVPRQYGFTYSEEYKVSTASDSYDIYPKTADINNLRNYYIPNYTISEIDDDQEAYSYTSIKTISEPSIRITALINPQINEQGNEEEVFIPNQTVPSQGITSVNPIYDDSDSRFTAWGTSRRFIEKATSYNYTTKQSWETGGDKKTFTSILSGDPSGWITNEKTTSSPTVNSQRTMTKTSKFSGSDDWKYETTLASTVIKHVTRTKTYFPIITDAVTTMLSTQNYTTTEYPITATKTTHNFNV